MRKTDEELKRIAASPEFQNSKVTKRDLAVFGKALAQVLKELRQQILAEVAVAVTQDPEDPRSFTMSFGNGTRHFFYLPVPLYRGTFQANTTYKRGDMCTFNGCLWHANVDTRSAPGTVQGQWQMAAKKGSDGKDLRNV